MLTNWCQTNAKLVTFRRTISMQMWMSLSSMWRLQTMPNECEFDLHNVHHFPNLNDDLKILIRFIDTQLATMQNCQRQIRNENERKNIRMHWSQLTFCRTLNANGMFRWALLSFTKWIQIFKRGEHIPINEINETNWNYAVAKIKSYVRRTYHLIIHKRQKHWWRSTFRFNSLNVFICVARFLLNTWQSSYEEVWCGWTVAETINQQ